MRQELATAETMACRPEKGKIREIWCFLTKEEMTVFLEVLFEPLGADRFVWLVVIRSVSSTSRSTSVRATERRGYRRFIIR